MSAEIQIEVTGLKEAQDRATKIALKLSNLSKPMRSTGQEIQKRTADAWNAGRNQGGDPFQPLAESTIRKRIGAHPKANRRTKAGGLTKGAIRTRSAMRAPGGTRPLDDTGYAKSSFRFTLAAHNEVQWRIVAYMRPSMTGGVRNGRAGMPPRRNPTCFIRARGSDFDFLGGGASKWALEPSMRLFLLNEVNTHILGE